MVTTTRSLAATNRPYPRPYHGAATATARATPTGPRLHARREAVLVPGICSAALGSLVAVWPGATISSLGLLFGIGLAINAGTQVFLAVDGRFAIALRAFLFLSGLLTAGFAALSLSDGNSVPMLSMWLGASWAILGVGRAIAAVWDDDAADAVPHEVVAAATMLTGIVVLLSPLESTTSLRIVGALASILLGAANLALAGVGRGLVALRSSEA